MRLRNNTTRPAAMSNRKGFSLVSMLVAMILLGVGVGALAHANGQTVTMQTLAQNRTNAIAIGRGYLELVRTRDPWTISSEAAVNVDADGQESASGSYRRSMTVTSSRQNLLHIEVTVNFPRGQQPIILKTSLFRGNGLSGMN